LLSTSSTFNTISHSCTRHHKSYLRTLNSRVPPSYLVRTSFRPLHRRSDSIQHQLHHLRHRLPLLISIPFSIPDLQAHSTHLWRTHKQHLSAHLLHPGSHFSTSSAATKDRAISRQPKPSCCHCACLVWQVGITGAGGNGDLGAKTRGADGE